MYCRSRQSRHLRCTDTAAGGILHIDQLVDGIHHHRVKIYILTPRTYFYRFRSSGAVFCCFAAHDVINLQPEALAFNGIDPSNPLRGAVSEYDALHAIFKMVRKGIKDSGCSRAIMVAHNATFDHSFMMAAAERASLKRNPFHPFVTFDTAALSGLALGQTVLSKACLAAGMEFDGTQAHSALYDTERTAVLFCEIVNRWKRLGGWPLPLPEEA